MNDDANTRGVSGSPLKAATFKTYYSNFNKIFLMKVVQGKYENGVVQLLEEVNNVSGKKVLITFFDEDDLEEKFLRELTLKQPEEFLKEYLSDEREDLYQQYLNKDNDNR